MTSSGPPCGWILAYIEALAAEYSMSLAAIFRLPVSAGEALLEARSCRLFPTPDRISYLDRRIIAARRQCRALLLSQYTLISTPKQSHHG